MAEIGYMWEWLLNFFFTKKVHVSRDISYAARLFERIDRFAIRDFCPFLSSPNKPFHNDIYQPCWTWRFSIVSCFLPPTINFWSIDRALSECGEFCRIGTRSRVCAISRARWTSKPEIGEYASILIPHLQLNAVLRFSCHLHRTCHTRWIKLGFDFIATFSIECDNASNK